MLDPRYYDSDGVMIGHELAPADRSMEGVFWCRVCGGHPTDPVHQPGWKQDFEGSGMDSASELVLAKVHPRLGGLVRSMASELLAENVEVRVIQGLRTWAQQDADYAKVPRVTNARGGWSMHNFGLAVDLCPYKVAGQPWVPDWDGSDEHYLKMVAAGVSVGLIAGANWTSFKDKPHFQLAGIPVTPTDAMRADFAAMSIESFWALVDAGKYGR